MPAPAALERSIFEGTGDPPDEHGEEPPPAASRRSRTTSSARRSSRSSTRRTTSRCTGGSCTGGSTSCAPSANAGAEGSTSTRRIWARSSAALDEPCLLPGVRLPEPRGRELLCPLRRLSPARRARRDDAEPRRRRSSATEPLHAGEPRGPGARRAGRRREGRGELRDRGPRTLIGRSPDCHVFLDDVTVSRRHAEIVREDDDRT